MSILWDRRRTLWDCTLGIVLLASPANNTRDWSLVGVALCLGFFVTIPPHWLIQPVAVGAALYSASRDFEIPYDALLLAAVPVAALGWRRSLAIDGALALGVVVSYVLAWPILPPEDWWTPAVAALLYMVSGPYKLSRAAIVLARYLAPRAAHVVYGMVLVICRPMPVPYYDKVAGPALAYTLCALLAAEPTYKYLATAAGIASCIVQYIKPRSL